MKKRILSMVLMSALAMSMAGCNSGTETPETTTERAEVTTTTAVAEEDTAEATTTTAPETEETTTTTEAIPVVTPKIKAVNGNSKDIIYFTDYDGNTYLYNLPEKKLVVTAESLNNYTTFEYSGGNIAVVYDSIKAGAVVNTKTGEIVQKFDEKGIVLSGINPQSGDIHFVKNEENFNGNTFKLAVMNNKGEWIHDFSDSDVFVSGNEFLVSEASCYFNGSIMMYSNETGYFLYSFNDKKRLPVETLYLDVSYTYKDKLFCYGDNNNNIVIDAEGNIQQYGISERVDLFRTGGMIINQKVYDYDTYEVIYDFSEYTVKRYYIGTATERAAAMVENPNGDFYIMVKNKDGSLPIEPLKSDGKFGFSGDYLVVYDEDYSDYECMIINLATKETKSIKKEECNYTVEDINEEGGMMIVKADESFYLVDPSDPDTLISPFEIADKIYTIEE